MKLTPTIISLVAMCAVGATATSLEFDGLQHGEQVLNYYAGGFGDLGSGPGPNFGVRFTDGLRADATEFAFGPSAQIAGAMATMSLDAPWNEAISFYFEGIGTLVFHSGPNASGSVIASYELVPGFPFGAMPGPFQSLTFLNAGGMRVDSITFGAMVIPEPSTLPLLAIASLAGALWGLAQRVRRLQ